ncbi:MAG: hypothetical protein ACRCS9_13190 [Hyphomicrobium sp.]
MAATALMIGAIGLALFGTLSSGARAEGRGTRVKPGEAQRVFVMAGFTPDCAFKGFPDMQMDAAPAKGAVAFKTGEATTIQYSLSGKCIGTSVEGTGIYYTAAPGQSGSDTFTVTGRLGNGEPATRTFSVIIDENGNPE